nr:hypothetical protein [Tanacetum cinerariifolium]
MATTIKQQTALDESLVPSSHRLRIGRSNFRLPSDIQSKEATLQVVYDVLRNSPLFRAFQVTADVPQIYMQEFWATAKLHHNSIRFKIDIRKRTGSKPGVPDVPSDDSEEELSWKSSEDEEVGSHEEDKESDDDSDEGSDKDSDDSLFV